MSYARTMGDDLLRPTRVKIHVHNRSFTCTIDKTKYEVLKYSKIAANYRGKLMDERTWLESLGETLKIWSSKGVRYDQQKVALLAKIMEEHMRPCEFLSAIMTRSLEVRPVYEKFQEDVEALRLKEAKGDNVSGQLHDRISQILGPQLYGNFYISFTRTTMKKEWVSTQTGNGEYFELKPKATDERITVRKAIFGDPKRHSLPDQENWSAKARVLAQLWSGWWWALEINRAHP